MKRYKVSVRIPARRMMREHVYFLGRVDMNAARVLRYKLSEAIKSLAEFPERFPRVDPEDDTNPYRKMFVPNWYIILYTVKEDTVYVDYVIDGRQDYGWLIGQ